MATIIELDNRRRASLGALAKADRYLVEVDEQTGVITMEPAVVMTQEQAWLLSRPDVLQVVQHSIATGEDVGRPVRRRPAR